MTIDNNLSELMVFFIAATSLMLLVLTNEFAQSFYNTRLMKFLGKISYSLYLLHGFPVFFINFPLTNFFEDKMSMSKSLAIPIVYIAVSILTIGLSTIFERTVDAPCI